VFGVVIPMMLMPFDRLDEDKNTTLTYACWCRKPALRGDAERPPV